MCHKQKGKEVGIVGDRGLSRREKKWVLWGIGG